MSASSELGIRLADVTNVFDRLIGQDALAEDLRRAAESARTLSARLDEVADGAVSMFADDAVEDLPVGVRESMTHAWLFTGPPGSGRSTAAAAFAAALECQSPDIVGCGECRACTTVLAGVHGDVRHIVPAGLTISVHQIRSIVGLAARRPTTGRWQIVIVEDADRLTEQAANALLKAVEEPPERTIFMLCAPSVSPEDIAITLRSRCRHVGLVSPSVDDIAQVLISRDGIDPDFARWAASVSSGHVGRAKRLATDESSRAQRDQALALARAATREATALSAADKLVKTAIEAAASISDELDAAEKEELLTVLGSGGTGKGTARAPRGSATPLKELEVRQRSRRTRLTRDVLDRALVDLVALFRDALAVALGASVTSMHPDKMADMTVPMARYASPEKLLTCIEAVLQCRKVLEENVKPKFAVGAMVVTLSDALARRQT